MKERKEVNLTENFPVAHDPYNDDTTPPLIFGGSPVAHNVAGSGLWWRCLNGTVASDEQTRQCGSD